jgi:hypothetical protein
MVASEFIDDIARGSGLWDVLNSMDTQERAGTVLDRSGRAPSLNRGRPGVKKRSLTSSILIEDALINW